MGRCQKVPKFDFQIQFSMSKIIGIFLFFSVNNTSLFRSTSFIIEICWRHPLLNHTITKMMPNFWQFATTPILQLNFFNNFPWICWFLGKNLSNFVSPDLKLYNQYYHSIGTSLVSKHTQILFLRIITKNRQ